MEIRIARTLPSIYQGQVDLDFLGGTDGKESACSVGDPGSVSGSGRSPGVGNGNSFQYSCLKNYIDRGAWRATVHGVTKSRTQQVTNTQMDLIQVKDLGKLWLIKGFNKVKLLL